ncbi:cytochrome-c peroxidase [Flavobacterium sp. RHBU_3]|uniref:cytochrome-c peroxidase n=1 Tax=Flavobacterium sp. RHBU_3 TaxID=3391184 RepID=UPI00398476F7
MFSAYIKTISVLFTAALALALYPTQGKKEYTETGTLKKFSLELNTSIEQLDDAAQKYKAGTLTIAQLQNAVTETRLAYKRAEFYFAFYYPEYTKEHFNGAPLLHIEKEGSMPKVISPEGLQTLDELVFSDEAAEEKVQIAAVAKKLHSAYIDFYGGLGAPDMKGANGLTAMRMQLVRILSMGITGFDTPGSLNALPETKASLEAMAQFYTENYPAAVKAKSLFTNAIKYLDANKDFDSFNRLVFIREYIDPLYKTLGEGAGNAPKFLGRTSAWNTDSQSIFAEDFLNPYFFATLKKEEDTAELRKLGQSLFYDKALSTDGSMSCASCHKPELAFTDGLPKSASSIQGKTVLRNAPTLLNAAYADRYFYDLRAFTLEQQAEHVIFNPAEFNTAYSAILKKLGQKPEYAESFKKVFGKKGINRENFSKALASYVLSLRSFNSPMDKYLRGETIELDQQAKNGFNLFMGKAACATCHFAPTFSGLVPPLYSENESEILGVLQDPSATRKTLDADGGRLDNLVLTEEAWIYDKSFKTTTVRNVALTAPYFHNGAYKTLEEVIDFYNEGGGSGIALTVKNQTLAADKLNLTAKEKKELIAFLKSLTDTAAADKK